MRISTKGRYALASVVYLAGHYNTGENITILSISESLGISKIYLEQIFSVLKKSGIVNSVKGAQGGYFLSKSPDDLTVFDILSSIEATLFEETESTVKDKAPGLENALMNKVFKPLDNCIFSKLKEITVHELFEEAKSYGSENYIFYI